MPISILLFDRQPKIWPADAVPEYTIGSHGHHEGWLLRSITGVPHPTGDPAEVPIAPATDPVLLAVGFERDKDSAQLPCPQKFKTRALEVQGEFQRLLATTLNTNLGRVPKVRVRESLMVLVIMDGKRLIDETSPTWFRVELSEGDAQLGEAGTSFLVFFGEPGLLRDSLLPIPDLTGLKALQLHQLAGETLDVVLPEVHGIKYDVQAAVENGDLETGE